MAAYGVLPAAGETLKSIAYGFGYTGVLLTGTLLYEAGCPGRPRSSLRRRLFLSARDTLANGC